MLTAASIAAADTTPTLTTRLKHPERTPLLSGSVHGPTRAACN